MNTITLEGPPVAKPKAKMGRPPAGRDESTVRIDRDLARRIKVLAAAKRITVAQFLSQRMRPIVDREYAQYVKGI